MQLTRKSRHAHVVETQKSKKRTKNKKEPHDILSSKVYYYSNTCAREIINFADVPLPKCNDSFDSHQTTKFELVTLQTQGDFQFLL